MTLFWLTEKPVTFEEFDKGEEYFKDLQGSDALVKVTLSSLQRQNEDRIPRRVLFDIMYYQKTAEEKLLVGAEMVMSNFDDDPSNEAYWLKLKFEALHWPDLMNKFQLPLQVYILLYCGIGLSAVSFTLIAWAVLRLVTRRSQTPPFRLKECYEFMLWWPLQGVMSASVPVCVICFIVKVMLHPAVDPMKNVPCTWRALGAGAISETEQERCRNGRTGGCLLLGGVLMLWTGSKLIVPALREVEEQFLLQQPDQMLNREGIPVPVQRRALVRTVPIRWKRAHLVLISLMLVMPLTIMWEFTYCDFFADNAIHAIVGFNIAMVPIEGALSRSVREELLQVPLSTACSVVLFIGTLGANDFQDFIEGFFIELLIGIVDRLVLVFIFRALDQAQYMVARWVRTRSWLWTCLLTITRGSPMMNKWLKMTDPEDEADEETEAEIEGTPIEEAMEEILGCGTACMSTILSPILITAMLVFAEETKIPDMYGIRITDLTCYLIFGLVIAPFQVMMDILMNHATEVAHGVRIYDYILYAKFRWRNRLTQWLYDDPRMDQSIAEPLQSVNHLCFSPQFYFIEAYYTWGMLMAMLAVTTVLRWHYNPWEDPTLAFFIVQQLICNRVMDKLIRFMCFSLLWKPKPNTNFRLFRRTVAISLKRKSMKMANEKYRNYFLDRHKGWLISEMSNIFTPRSRERYRSKLSLLYQQVLMLQPAHLYKVPGPAFPAPVAKEELPQALQDELEEASTSSEEGVEDLPLAGAKPGTPAAVGPAMIQNPYSGEGAEAQQALPPLEWPLALKDEDEGSGGYGPLAVLIGKGWLITVRRHLRMKVLYKELEEDWPVAVKCSGCGASEEDPFVQARIGVWKDGAQLRLSPSADQDVDKLINQFDESLLPPSMELDEEQWFMWLERHELFTTLCVRCRQPPRDEALAVEGAATLLPIEAGGLGALANASSSSGSASSGLAFGSPPALTGFAFGTPPALPAPAAASSSALALIEEERAADIAEEKEEMPELADVEVSLSTREIVLWWAGQAAKRVRARRAIVDTERFERQLRAQDTDSSEED
eukprot:TRINITY_DN27535_c0_g1_i1.p1 TRINITY_DN27535_c0_g1~~TRINITY_DN27535_c0_g1_i1.p1  ORF type:complete len:1110 (+),score=252.25 TRINITY_DN27535_c0_g1_i1:164-3331(+)